MKNKLEQIPIPLLTWFEEHQRTLPWRSDPLPYKVWLSEIMLQQTRVAAVLPYFRRFMEQFPTVTELANAELDTVLKLWQGLGYYSRARSLHKAAGIIRDEYGGVFPTDYAAVRNLPGVGDYTAAAICSISYGLPVPVVDGNVLRVVTRLTADDRDILKNDTKKQITAALSDIIPTKAVGEFNQAMMELGALVCLPNGAPLCDACPLAFCCLARETDQTERFPVKTPKKPRKIEERTVYVIFRDGKVALRKRPERGLLAGLYEFPNELGEPEWQLPGTKERHSMTAKHVFTHIEWHMKTAVIHAESEALPNGCFWATWEEVEKTYAIPHAFDAFLPLVKKEIGSESSWQNFITGMA